MVFKLSRIKVAGVQTCFSAISYLHKNDLYAIVPILALESFDIVMHSHVASFLIKTCFYELTTKRVSQNVTVSENTLKIKAMLP